MKYILPTLGTASAVALFAFASSHTADAKPRDTKADTFQQLELFADVLARVRNDYVVDVDDGEMINDAINGMLQSLDPHSSYVPPEEFMKLQESTSGEYGGLGMEVTSEDGVVKVIAPIDGSPAKRQGVLAGDYITEVDGETILGLALNEAVEKMRGKPGEPITITVVRMDEDPMEIEMVREIIKRPPVVAEVKDGMGYLRIGQFNEKTNDSLNAGVKQLKRDFGGRIPGVVLDLRGNPGGLLDQSIKVSSAFLDGGEVVSTRGRAPEDSDSYNADRGELLEGVPVVVLIDNASASASEIVAGAIQDRGRGLVIGRKSFGKGSVQSVIPLRGGRDGALRLTTQRYYTPSGASIQGMGITPDIFISAVPDDGKESKRRRESDLPNSIRNEAFDALEESQRDGEAEPVIEYPPEGYEVENDYQLQRAIEILKDGSYARKLAAVEG